MLLLSDLTLGVNESVSSALLLTWCNMEEEQASHCTLTKASSSAAATWSSACLAWITGCRMQLVGHEESRWWLPTWTAASEVWLVCNWHLQRKAAKHANFVRHNFENETFFWLVVVWLVFWQSCVCVGSKVLHNFVLCSHETWIIWGHKKNNLKKTKDILW